MKLLRTLAVMAPLFFFVVDDWVQRQKLDEAMEVIQIYRLGFGHIEDVYGGTQMKMGTNYFVHIPETNSPNK